MDKYIINGTLNTPDINFDFKSGVLNISGRSISKNSIEFYNPLLSAIDAYISNPKDNTVLNIQLEYFNSSSSACLLSVFKKLEKFKKEAGFSVTINWLYEENDDDILADGKDFEGIIDLPFNMIQVSEN